MNISNKNILVTGGSGFIGGQTCIQLIEAGYNVVSIDFNGRPIPGVTLYNEDIGQANLVKILKDNHIDTIMHFAAFHEVARSVSEPGLFYNNNVSNTITLLNAAVQVGVGDFIFSSSSSVYGNITNFPTNEDTPKAPISSYGKSKLMVEDMLKDYVNAYGLKFIALRYFNAAGADPNGNWGYRQEIATHIIPILLRAAINGNVIKIFGDDYDTFDGTCIRDYTHVYDIATAHIAAMNYLDHGGESGVFNIGSGLGNSLLELIEAFKEITKIDVQYEICDRRPGDPACTMADITKTSDAFNWKPIKTFNDIILDAYFWELKQNK